MSSSHSSNQSKNDDVYVEDLCDNDNAVDSDSDDIAVLNTKTLTVERLAECKKAVLVEVGGKRSTVWKHFACYKKSLQSSMNGNRMAVCKLCHSAFVKATGIAAVPHADSMHVNLGPTLSTSKLTRHITRHHPVNDRADRLEEAQQTSIGNTIHPSYKPMSGAVKKEAFIEGALLWTVKSYQPFCEVESVYFRKMIAVLDPKIQPFSKATLRDRALTKEAEIRTKLARITQGEKHALTMDCWTSG